MDPVASSSAFERFCRKTYDQCANCCKTLPQYSKRVFSTYTAGNGNADKSIYEGLKLLFCSTQAPSVIPNNIKLCFSCGNEFNRLMKLYVSFTGNTNPSSVVNFLQKLAGTNHKENNDRPEAMEVNGGVHFEGMSEDSLPLEVSLRVGIPTTAIQDQHQEGYIPVTGPVSVEDIKEEEPEINGLGYFLPDLLSEEAEMRANTESASLRNSISRRKQTFHNASHIPNVDAGVSLPSVSASKPKSFPASADQTIADDNNIKLQCKGCLQFAPSFRRLKICEASHDATRRFSCLECKKSFKSKQIWRNHNRLKHSDPDMPPSPEQKRTELTEEQKAILNSTIYKCDMPECVDLTFTPFKEWVLHQKLVHNVETGYDKITDDLAPSYRKMRPCPECGKKLQSKTQIIVHVKLVHFKFRDFTCEICEKSFACKNSLNLHRDSIHNGVPANKDFLCTLCGEAFIQKGTLVLHERAHFDQLEKKHECDICHARFGGKSNLEKHKISIHTAARNYACDKCDASFKLPNHLKSHQHKSHYKKYILDEICEVCGKAYAFKIRLKEHLMSVHKMSKEEARVAAKLKRPSLFRVLPNGDRVFKEKPTKPKSCSYCGRTYARREYLYTHLISVHGKTELEAKEITGLETKRNLIVPTGGRKKRKIDTFEMEEAEEMSFLQL